MNFLCENCIYLFTTPITTKSYPKPITWCLATSHKWADAILSAGSVISTARALYLQAAQLHTDAGLSMRRWGCTTRLGYDFKKNISCYPFQTNIIVVWDQLTDAKTRSTQTQYNPIDYQYHHYWLCCLLPLHYLSLLQPPRWPPLQTEVNVVHCITFTRCRQPPRLSYNTAAWPSPRSSWTRRVTNCSSWTVERATWRPAIVEPVLPVGCQLVTLCIFNCGSWRPLRGCTTSLPGVWLTTSSCGLDRGKTKSKIKTPTFISAEQNKIRPL